MRIASRPDGGNTVGGTKPPAARSFRSSILERSMNGLIYLVGLVVVIMAVLSFFGLR
jgi:hypothetical protein